MTQRTTEPRDRDAGTGRQRDRDRGNLHPDGKGKPG